MPTVPLNFVASPLSVNFSGTLQELFDAYTARLSAESPTPYSLFVSGSVAPTSDVGPWLKNGTTWYVWSAVAGAYVPATIEDKQRKFIASATAPSATDYTLWIETVGGVAKAIKYFSGGSWRDVYEDKFALYSTTTQMNTAIANAISTATEQYPFRATKSAANQTITGNAAAVQVVFDVETFDPNAVYASNEFTAPADGYYFLKASVRLVLNAGAPTGISRYLNLRVAGTVTSRTQIQTSNDTGDCTLSVSDEVFMTAGQKADVTVEVLDSAAATYDVTNDGTQTYFTGHKILT